MPIRLRTTAMLAILATCSALALAQAPGRVGRISVTQGQVNIAGEVGEQVDSAVINWPVTSRNQITTGRDSRTEIRIGSTAVRLDADSALDVVELNDEATRLHLHYGSAIVRVRNAESLRGFELSTPQGIVRLQDIGRVRVDAGRRRDTTVVSVFDGVALIDGGGSRLTVRAGKRAEMSSDDIRTGLAVRDGFDEWAMLRDARDDRSESVRYVGREMTGYEDLDQYGSWRDDAEYGPLWSPRQVSAGWVPYRDGRWTYLQPWGWTWVDNAPWGYAPFHYGRWVTVSNRWYWAPGRAVSRAIWSPALVGWVGGSNWNVPFSHQGTRRPAPAQGWYPLAPRDAYVPTYRTSHEHLRDVNRYAGTPGQDVKRRYGPGPNSRQGLTVVPQEQFNQRGTIAVRNTPQPVVSPSVLAGAPMFMPPAPAMTQRERRSDYRNDNRNDGRVRVERGAGAAMGSAVSQAVEAANRANQVPVISNAQLPPVAVDGRRDERFRNDEQRRMRMDNQAPANDNSIIARAQAQAEAAAQGQAAEQVRQQQAQQMQAQQAQAQAQMLQAQQQQAQFQQMQAQQEQMRARAQFQQEARSEIERERRRAPESIQQRQQPRQEAPPAVGFAQPTQERAIAPISPPPQRQESERREQREERRQLREEMNDKR